jgi:hypothetical protein
VHSVTRSGLADTTRTQAHGHTRPIYEQAVAEGWLRKILQHRSAVRARAWSTVEDLTVDTSLDLLGPRGPPDPVVVSKPLGGSSPRRCTGCCTRDYNDAERLKIINSIRSMIRPHVRALEPFGVFQQH